MKIDKLPDLEPCQSCGEVPDIFAPGILEVWYHQKFDPVYPQHDPTPRAFTRTDEMPFRARVSCVRKLELCTHIVEGPKVPGRSEGEAIIRAVEAWNYEQRKTAWKKTEYEASDEYVKDQEIKKLRDKVKELERQAICGRLYY